MARQTRLSQNFDTDPMDMLNNVQHSKILPLNDFGLPDYETEGYNLDWANSGGGLGDNMSYEAMNQGGGGGGWFDGFLGKTNADGSKTAGWGGMAVQGVLGAGKLLLGYKQLKAAEKAGKEQRRQFDLNFGAQRQVINGQLRDRQRARVASNANAYQSVGAYMQQNQIA